MMAMSPEMGVTSDGTEILLQIALNQQGQKYKTFLNFLCKNVPEKAGAESKYQKQKRAKLEDFPACRHLFVECSSSSGIILKLETPACTAQHLILRRAVTTSLVEVQGSDLAALGMKLNSVHHPNTQLLFLPIQLPLKRSMWQIILYVCFIGPTHSMQDFVASTK